MVSSLVTGVDGEKKQTDESTTDSRAARGEARSRWGASSHCRKRRHLGGSLPSAAPCRCAVMD